MSNKPSPKKEKKNGQSSMSKSKESNSSNQSAPAYEYPINGASGVTKYNGHTSSSSPPSYTNTNVSSQRSATGYTHGAPSYATYSHYTNYNHGQCGLENLGTTCFMNCILQCLISIPPLVQYYSNRTFRSSLSNWKHPVSTVFANLIESMRTFSVVRPVALKDALCQHTPQVFDFGQQDSHEYLTLLLDVLHRESSTEAEEEDNKTSSIITTLFQGEMQYILKCSSASECKNVTNTTDPFLDIPVFIDDKVTTTTILGSIFKVRFFLIDGQKKMIHFPYSSTDTIQSIIDHLLKTSSNSSRKSVIAMKVSADNTFSAQYRSLVLLTQIDDQSTIFYEMDDNNTDPITVCLFLEKSRSSFNQIYNSPPVLLNLTEYNGQSKLRSYLSKHFDSFDLPYEIGEDPFIHTIPTYQSSSYQKTILVHIDERIIRQSQVKKVTEQTRQESSVALEQCLKNNILDVERMSPNSTWFCPNCHRNRQLTKENHILSLPQVLIIHLKRFNMESSSRTKIETFVKYPLELNMNKFLSSSSTSSPHKKYMYDLIGVCLHSGSFERGHYTAYTKRSSRWFSFNDSFVEPISANDVVHRNAYILFYLRRDH